ncbi:probable G-protein coupled receptor 82 [Hyperolius riggenbachi]|uniref:probable G-protein coupled receptor 82 n=1 Tax=Hyperolius riggenbachi TaxID=752182 RepID=UPI0035A2DFE4
MCNDTCLVSSAVSTTALPIIYTMMFLTSIFGNIVSIWILTTSRRSTTHIYLINLTISNMAVTIGMPFHVVFYIQSRYWLYNSIQCSIVLQTQRILTHSSMAVSISIFCWIAISRYATLVRYRARPQNASTYEKIIFGRVLKTFRNPKFASYLCGCMWISYLCPSFIFFSVRKELGPDTCCFNEEAELGQERFKISSIIESTIFFIFLLIVLLFYFFFIKHIRNLQANSCIEDKHLVHNRVKKNIIIIIGLLLVCFAPYHVTKLFVAGLEHFQGCHHLSVLVEIKNGCLCLAEFRSCTDPIVYYCLDSSFQKKIQSFFKMYPTNKQDSSAENRYSDTPTTVNGSIGPNCNQLSVIQHIS